MLRRHRGSIRHRRPARPDAPPEHLIAGFRRPHRFFFSGPSPAIRPRARAQDARKMNMTHYMELLATNQPWNLLIFMAVPIVLAETVAITELAVLYTRATTGAVRAVNRAAGIAAGVWFTGIFLYLLQAAAIPLTLHDGWRGPIDVVAVGFYLFGIVPLGGIALLDTGLLARSAGATTRMKLHAACVGLFLVTAHVAMIAGMLDPTLATAAPAAMADMHMHGG
jgi:hypothetical protein